MVCGWCGWISNYGAFLQAYPYCGRQLWALLLMDHIGPILDIYVYLTINNDNWLTRAADTQDIKDQDVDNAEEMKDVGECLIKSIR